MAESKPSFFASLRDLFAACREFAIVAFIVLLFVKPVLIRAALQNAGIKTFGGIEFWDQALEDGDAAVTADNTIKHLQQKLDSIANELSAEGNAAAQKVQESVAELKVESDQARSQLQSRIEEQVSVLEKAPPAYRMKTSDKLERIQSYRNEIER